MKDRYVVLLRGINVGRNKRIAMADFRALLDALGCEGVDTVLQSGNALVTAAGSAAEIERDVEAGVAARFGVEVRCVVRTGAELVAAIDANPLPVPNGSRFLGLFLSERPDARLLAANDPVALDPGRVAMGDRVIYQWCPDGVLAAPPVSAFVERQLKVGVTARNWNTLARLAAAL
jgi:uncharacterized protein (DUF1697 family)